MRVLVGPVMENKAQTNNYCYTEPGEIMFLWDCPCREDNCDKFNFTGIESKRSSLFAEVAERPDINEANLAKMFVDDLKQRGWTKEASDEQLREQAVEHIGLLKGLYFFDVGAIVSRTPTGVFVPEQFRNDATIYQFRPATAA